MGPESRGLEAAGDGELIEPNDRHDQPRAREIWRAQRIVDVRVRVSGNASDKALSLVSYAAQGVP